VCYFILLFKFGFSYKFILQSLGNSKFGNGQVQVPEACMVDSIIDSIDAIASDEGSIEIYRY